MRKFKATKKADVIEISYVAEITEKDALKRKHELKMTIENYNHQLKRIEDLKDLAERELEELSLVVADETIPAK